MMEVHRVSDCTSRAFESRGETPGVWKPKDSMARKNPDVLEIKELMMCINVKMLSSPSMLYVISGA